MVVYCFAVAGHLLGAELHVEDDKENVVASRILGDWETDVELDKRLRQRDGNVKTLRFESAPEIIRDLPARDQAHLKEKKIYLAGHLIPVDGKKLPFFLIEHHGNPHVVFYLEKDGDRFGNGESFNVMLAVAKNKENDLLFIGGDFNNEAFAAYKRVRPKPE